MLQCIEPSAGVGVAALLSDAFKERYGASVRRVAVILCGGNVDLTVLPWVRPDGTFVEAPSL